MILLFGLRNGSRAWSTGLSRSEPGRVFRAGMREG